MLHDSPRQGGVIRLRDEVKGVCGGPNDHRCNSTNWPLRGDAQRGPGMLQTGSIIRRTPESSRLIVVVIDWQSAAGRGYDASLLGYVEYDVKADRIDRFDVVALGDHWGEGTFTRGARPGRTPLGVAFERASGDKPGDTVPPQAAREVNAYGRP